MKDKRIVKLRRKKEKNGKVSLFLDKYIDGKRTYEYLRMYLIGDKQEDAVTLAVAQKICDERNKTAQEELMRKYNDNIRNITIQRFVDLYCPNYRRIKYWIGKEDKVCDINKDYERLFVQRMIDSDLNNNTKKNYISIFRVIKNKAIDMDAISLYKSPSYNIKATPHERQYLSIEEVKEVANLELSDPYLKIVRDAFCFSCLTGLRVSDLRTLSWEDVREQDGYKRIVFQQTKTKSREYLDISESACRFLGERGKGCVFPTDLCNERLERIIKKTTIKKHITFHCARHTFAIMMLGLGVDIYTLSKLLGHSDIAITQVYARILDKGKRSAVDLIPEI